MKLRKLALRTCNQDGTSYGGFQWPLEVGAKVSAPDWNPEPECGNGLHGLLWGAGYCFLLNCLDPDRVWMVVEVEDYVDFEGKIKFPECIIRYIGDRDGAVEMIQKEAPPECMVNFARKTVGENQIAAVGDYGTAIAGFGGTAIAGGNGTATAGDLGVAIAGGRGKATAGSHGRILINYFDSEDRLRTLVGYIGENGLKPNTPYRVEDGKFVEET